MPLFVESFIQAYFEAEISQFCQRLGSPHLGLPTRSNYRTPPFKISAYGPVFTSVNNLNQAVESGSDDLDYLGHFLMGQVGLIHELNYLDVMQTFNRSHGCMHVLWKKTLAFDKQVNLGSDECTEPSLV